MKYTGRSSCPKTACPHHQGSEMYEEPDFDRASRMRMSVPNEMCSPISRLSRHTHLGQSFRPIRFASA
jgi:hypothetical protein